MNPYEILGVQPDASPADITAAYRKLAKQYHPDVATGEAEKFREVTAAYDILSNPERRRVYDETGSDKAAARGTEAWRSLAVMLVVAQAINNTGRADWNTKKMPSPIADITETLRDRIATARRNIQILKERGVILTRYAKTVRRAVKDGHDELKEGLESAIMQGQVEAEAIAIQIEETQKQIDFLNGYTDDDNMLGGGGGLDLRNLLPGRRARW